MWLTLVVVPALMPLMKPSIQPPLTTQILEEAESVHTSEIRSETASAFLGGARQQMSAAVGGFTTHHVGVRHAGPDCDALGSASASVHVSEYAVLTRAECLSIRLEAQLAMALGKSSDFTYSDVARIGEVHVADLPNARRALRACLAATILPAVADRFPKVDEASLRVCDAVVLRYDASRSATRSTYPSPPNPSTRAAARPSKA
jgi:hypothetical protein